MKETKMCLKIYQSVVILVMAVIIALVPSLLIWKYHILSPYDPAVIIGLAACYIFALAAFRFAGGALLKRLPAARELPVS